MTTVLKHSNPGPAHGDTARLLGQAWGRSVSFGLSPMPLIGEIRGGLTPQV